MLALDASRRRERACDTHPLFALDKILSTLLVHLRPICLHTNIVLICDTICKQQWQCCL